MMLNPSQFAMLSDALHQAVDHAAVSLGKWIHRDTSISIDSVEQILLQDAAQVLGEDQAAICCCTMQIKGKMSGGLILAFDDQSGLALADMLLDQSPNTATQWDELEQSAALETANIVCCAYLNELARILPDVEDRPNELLPGPPTFRRDFAESVLQAAFMEQAVSGDHLFVAHAAFQIEGASVNWNLLFIPDAVSMEQMKK